MRRAVPMLGVILAFLAIAPAHARADGGAPVRIRDVRVGEHSGFERLVIELDSVADVVWEKGPEPGEDSFYIAAAPAQSSRVIVTKLPHMGTVSVIEMKGGTHVAVEPRARRVRAYTLTNPPRLVVDFAPPAAGEFEAPAGTRALMPATALGPLVLEPDPEPEPEPPAAETAPVPKPSPDLAAEPEPEAPLLETPATSESPATPEPARMPEPEPELAAKPTAPPPTPEIAKPPAPAPSTKRPGAALPYGLAFATLLGLFLLIAAAVVLMRQRAARSESLFSVFPHEEEDARAETNVDEISPAEILAAGDHDGLLEKRLDEEVRARLELEQRFAHANEELKVLRDRLHRLERRREGAS